jgi:glutathione synthase/RimK-type ligase-like ATP-grasp enzyme
LPGRRNLAAVGRAERLIERVPHELARTALAAAHFTGLHIAGVDLMDISANGDLSQVRVIEVNGAPGLTALEQFGRIDLVLEVWRRIFIVIFGTGALASGADAVASGNDPWSFGTDAVRRS